MKLFKKKKVVKKESPKNLEDDFVHIKPDVVMQTQAYQDRDRLQFDMIESYNNQDKIKILFDITSCHFGCKEMKYYLHFGNLVKQRYKNKLDKLVVLSPTKINVVALKVFKSLVGRNTATKIEFVHSLSRAHGTVNNDNTFCFLQKLVVALSLVLAHSHKPRLTFLYVLARSHYNIFTK